jgi:toxin HigB-1
MINKVVITKAAFKDLEKAPRSVVYKFYVWVDLVKSKGIDNARTISGFHDEKLRGDRKGQFSIRLNIQWRAFYTIENDNDGEPAIKFVRVFEVNKHEY